MAWVITGLLPVAGALSYGELAAMMPPAWGADVERAGACALIAGQLANKTATTPPARRCFLGFNLE